MISRERLIINHKKSDKTDKIVLDIGSTHVTGIQAIIYKKLKEVLGLKKGIVRFINHSRCWQMLKSM